MNIEDEFLTFSEVARRFPAFTESGLRWHRFQNTSGFNRCVRRVGRKVVISLNDFLNWLNECKD